MNRRILEILTVVMKEIRENSFDEVDLQFIIDMLSERGFSDSEISSAMSWLMSHGENIDRLFASQATGVPRPLWRTLNEEEKRSISPDAFSYLFRLRELQLLGDNDVEAIIERAVKLQIPQINIEDMQDLIAIVVLDFDKSASGGYFQFTSNRLPH
jgi:uncharacterized protein Smg (DUF494 family)